MEPHPVSSDASLRLLGDELKSLGMVVVTRNDGLEVRLSTFETVHIRLVDSVLHCEPHFGAVPRTRARWTFQIFSAVLVPALFLTSGITAVNVSVAFLLVLAAVSQAVRYTVTESLVSRIQMVWLNLRRLSSASTARDTASLGAAGFNPDAALRAPAYVEERGARSQARPSGDKEKA